MSKKICVVCGKEFKPKQPDQKCCCEKHGNALYRKQKRDPQKHHYVCMHCGKQYSTRRKECDKFCSRQCSDIHRKQIAKYEKQKKAPRILHSCQFCNKEFIGYIHQRFHSKECATKYYLQKCLNERLKNHIEQMHICKECGTEFIPLFGNKHRLFCSDKCGHKHNNRIGKATRNRRIHNSVIERFDPFDVFIRDNWYCQLCGVKTPKRLRGTLDDCAPELDHIIPLALGGAHVMTNVQCLCRRCNQAKGATIARQLRLC